jgi:TPP-dependent indolepyruvate ferredoxin oxidoreductase alpha subunit
MIYFYSKKEGKMYFEDDEILGGTPKSRFFDIVFNANRNIVEKEIEEIIEWMGALELIIEEKCNLDVEKEVRNILYDESKKEQLEQKVNSLYIEYMGKILSQSE